MMIIVGFSLQSNKEIHSRFSHFAAKIWKITIMSYNVLLVLCGIS